MKLAIAIGLSLTADVNGQISMGFASPTAGRTYLSDVYLTENAQ